MYVDGKRVGDMDREEFVDRLDRHAAREEAC
jgi:hypothetical protein